MDSSVCMLSVQIKLQFCFFSTANFTYIVAATSTPAAQSPGIITIFTKFSNAVHVFLHCSSYFWGSS